MSNFPCATFQITVETGKIEIDTPDGPPFIVSVSEGNKPLADLTIPQRYRSGVALLAAMSNEAFDALLKASKSGLIADDASDLVSALGKKFEVLRKQSKLSEIIAAAASMQGIFHRSLVTPEQFAQDVVEALTDDAPDLAKKTDSSILSARIIKLARGKHIDITEQKIKSLQMEVERSFCCVRILTDVRAAFTADPTVAPTGMTILNTLRIGYLDDQAEHREFYLGMDSDDLSNLKKTIDRALKKSKTLEALLAKAKCRLYE
jgi:hypothetical protein